VSRHESETTDGRESALVAALIELLAASPAATAQLVELLESQRPAQQQLALPAYTVASLAAALGLSPRTVRGAITRGELAAVKRGGRWIISAEAVRAWAQHDAAARRAPARRPGVRRDRPLASAIALVAGASAAQRSL
jgi:excisionase family DNA binding protein